MIAGKGCFWSEQNETEQKFSVGQGIIVTPGFLQYYGGDNEYYVEDSIGFSGPIAETLQRTGIIKPGIINTGAARCLLPIIEKLRQPSLDIQLDALVSLQSLLLQLHNKKNQSAQSKNTLSRLDFLLNEIQKNLDRVWTVTDMADYCNLSSSQLRREFKKITGMAPKDYVDDIKIKSAIELLGNSILPVKEIALQLGYTDPFHFSRRFKQITSYSPDNYRKKFSSLRL